MLVISGVGQGTYRLDEGRCDDLCNIWAIWRSGGMDNVYIMHLCSA